MRNYSNRHLVKLKGRMEHFWFANLGANLVPRVGCIPWARISEERGQGHSQAQKFRQNFHGGPKGLFAFISKDTKTILSS